MTKDNILDKLAWGLFIIPLVAVGGFIIYLIWDLGGWTAVGIMAGIVFFTVGLTWAVNRLVWRNKL